MRAILIAAVTAAGLGLVATSASQAAPVNAIVISKAAVAGAPVEQVHWRWYHRHHWWRHHHHRRWW